MSYLDQRMSPARLWAIVFVAIFHVVIGFVFVTGFYQKFTKDGVQDIDVFEVEEEPPPPEEEPPPPEEIPETVAPEIVVPPPVVPRPTPPQEPIRTTDVIPDRQVITPTAPPPRPEPPRAQTPPPVPPPRPVPTPPPAAPPTQAQQIGGSISDADYPDSAIRAEAQGTTRVSIQVGADGRVAGCNVTGSSGNGALDSTACNLIRRRFRYKPATRGGQPVPSTLSRSITWRLPRE